jgi:hypothetical protein
MRTVFSACLLLAFAGALPAQSGVPQDQCLGGTLIAAQPDSVTLKFNQKTTTYRLTPDVEIWRRGKDLESAGQLAPGDEIYLVCRRAADTGAVVASVVAAVEKDDVLELIPHHIVEHRVCIGRLIKATPDTLSVRNDDGVCTLHINPGIRIWRGELFPDTSALELGDDISSGAIVHYPDEELIAELVEANVAKSEGTVVAVRPGRIEVKEDRVRVRTTVLLDSRTEYLGERRPFRKGDFVLAIGLDLGHNTFRATSIQIENQ